MLYYCSSRHIQYTVIIERTVDICNTNTQYTQYQRTAGHGTCQIIPPVSVQYCIISLHDCDADQSQTPKAEIIKREPQPFHTNENRNPSIHGDREVVDFSLQSSGLQQNDGEQRKQWLPL